MRQRLGIDDTSDTFLDLWQATLEHMSKCNIDYHGFFLWYETGNENYLTAEHTDAAKFIKESEAVSLREHADNPIKTPKFLLRNSYIQESISSYASNGDDSLLQSLLKASANPYELENISTRWQMPPENDQKSMRLSCSA